MNDRLPSSTPDKLAEAIIETIDTGANIINLSVGITSSSLMKFKRLQEAYDYAFNKGIFVIAASGNQGNIGYSRHNESSMDNIRYGV